MTSPEAVWGAAIHSCMRVEVVVGTIAFRGGKPDSTASLISTDVCDMPASRLNLETHSGEDHPFCTPRYDIAERKKMVSASTAALSVGF